MTQPLPQLPEAPPRLTVVVPAHYEQEVIGDTLAALHRDVATPFRVFVVYDRDEDPTAVVVRDGASRWPEASLMKNAYGRGALGAIRTGLESATTPFVVVFMADMSDNPLVINDMLSTAERTGAAIVSGSRYMAGGRQVGGPRLKTFLSRTAGRTLHLLTRIPTHDATNSFRLYRRDFLQSVRIDSRGGFEVGLELTVKAYLGGALVTEVPASWEDRTAGESKFQLRRWLPLYLRWYLYALRHAPFGIGVRKRA